MRPDPIIDIIMGYRKAKVLMAAAYLDLFSRLRRGRSSRDASRLLKLDPRATEILLDALVSVGLLHKRSGIYRNTPLSDRFLVSGRPGYLGNNLKYQEIIWDAWSQLRPALQKGGAVRPLGYWLSQHPGFTPEYIMGMDNIARAPSREIAALFPAGSVRDILDVGAGPGTYTLAFLERNPQARATILDLPGTLRVTRRSLARYPKLARRVTLRAGDYTKTSFGRGEFDAVLLSHITHDESPDTNQALIAKSYRALRPEGRVLVHDFVVRKDRTQPEFGALFSVHMLVYTSGGRTYTVQEYSQWLRAAGFCALTAHPIAVDSANASCLIAARKPA